MMNVNGHADENGGQKRKYVSLNQHHNDLKRRDTDRQRNGDNQSDADTRNRFREHFRK